METFGVNLTAQELEDIRLAVAAEWLRLGDREQEKSMRLSALMEKLAGVWVTGHA